MHHAMSIQMIRIPVSGLTSKRLLALTAQMDTCNIYISLNPTPPAYLYGLLDVHAWGSDGAEQVVEAAHLLCQHCVHALIVGGGEAPHHSLQVEVCRQLAQDVSCHIKDHVIWGFGVSAWRAGLIRDTERQRDGWEREAGLWQFIIFREEIIFSPSLTCHIMYSIWLVWVLFWSRRRPWC